MPSGCSASPPHDRREAQIYRGVVPFLVAPMVLIVLLFLFPQLALWLPKFLYG
jgi:C4-dicarboxylate transporter, DctM subunit